MGKVLYLMSYWSAVKLSLFIILNRPRLFGKEIDGAEGNIIGSLWNLLLWLNFSFPSFRFGSCYSKPSWREFIFFFFLLIVTVLATIKSLMRKKKDTAESQWKWIHPSRYLLHPPENVHCVNEGIFWDFFFLASFFFFFPHTNNVFYFYKR